jgi:hypothetical protein
VICIINPHHFCGWSCGGDGGLDLRPRAILVACAADEELGHGAVGEEIVAVVAVFGMDGKAECDGSFDAGIGTGGAEADIGAEGESGEEQGQAKAVVEPIEGGADIVLLAAAVVVGAFAESCAAEVEAEDGQSERVEGLHGVVDDLVVHGATAEGVWMAEQDGVAGVGRAGVEQGFEASGWAGEVFDGADGGVRVGHLLLGKQVVICIHAHSTGVNGVGVASASK